MNVLEFFKYATLATAAYVRAGELDPADANYQRDFAREANDQADGRLPLSIAQYLFDPPPGSNVTPWTISYYYGSDNTADPNASQSKSGFAATLFRKSGENVLARQRRRNLSPCAFTT